MSKTKLQSPLGTTAGIKPQSIPQATRWIAKAYLRPYSLIIGLIIAAMIAQTAATVYFVDFVRVLTDEMFNSPQSANVWALVVVVLVVFLVRGMSSLFQRAGIEHVLAKSASALRNDLVLHLSRVNFDSFDRYDPGVMSARIGNNVNELKGQLSMNLVAGVVGIFTLVGLTGYLFTVNFWLACIMLVSFGLVGACLVFINRQMKKVKEAAVKHFTALSVDIDTFASNQKSLRANQLLDWANQQLARAIKGNEMASRRQGYLLGVMAPVVDIILGVAIAFVIFLAFIFLRAGSLEAAEMSAFLVALLQLFIPLKRVMSLSGGLKAMSVTIGSIRWIFDLPLESQEHIDANIENLNVLGDIRFSNVSFGYGPQPQAPLEPRGAGTFALDDASFEIPGGKMTMIMGPTGSGKSTISSLLLGLYDVTHGTLALDQVPLTLSQRQGLRGVSSFVGQEIILSNVSAKENLRPFAKLEDTASARKRFDTACAEIFDSLDLSQIATIANGEDLGPRGSKLSGGQRQRMALAQALIAAQPIAIFDEPTSALDAKTSHSVLELLANKRQGLTTIMIVHDTSLLAFADHVISMEQGQVTFAGPAPS